MLVLGRALLQCFGRTQGIVSFQPCLFFTLWRGRFKTADILVGEKVRSGGPEFMVRERTYTPKTSGWITKIMVWKR